MTQQDRVLPAILMMLGFCLTAPLIDVAAKLAAAVIPVGQITTARFLVQALLMAPICLLMGFRLWPDSRTRSRIIARAVFLIVATYCFVAAIRVMPIADALAIVFVEPFLLLILGYAIFGDSVGPRRIGASLVGFLGSLLVIQPSFAAFGAVALYPLGTALTFTLYMLVTRSLSRHIHPLPMQYQTALAASAICLPAMWLMNGSGVAVLDPVWPSGIFWILLIGVGLAASVAHLLMTYALQMAPAATLAPLHYLEIVSAVAFGYLIFDDFPDPLTWTGIAVIVGSGLYIIHRERITARETATRTIATGSKAP